MRGRWRSLGALTFLAVGTPIWAAAQESSTPRRLGFSLGVRFSTLGFGLEANKLLFSHLGVRVGGNFFKASTTRTNSGITYDASVKLHGVSVLADFYPGGRGSFHLTGGILSNPVTVSGDGVPTASGQFTINGTPYSSSTVGALSGSVKYPSILPYVGLGFGTPARKGSPLEFLFDIGAGIGEAKVALTATGAASNPQLASDLDAQAKQTQNDIDKYAKLWPVLGFGFAYRF
jgi:hypothetical protein